MIVKTLMSHTRNCSTSVSSRVVFAAIAFVATLLLPASTLLAQDPANKTTDTNAGSESDLESMEFFRDEVLPLLQSRCYSCHSHEAGKSKGGLVVDSQTGLTTGGQSGPAIAKGDAEASLIIRAVRGKDDEVSAMPPEEKLTDAEIGVLVRWINSGAPDSRVPKSTIAPIEQIWKDAEGHWSFQPLTQPEVPAARSDSSSSNPIDRFVDAKLQSLNYTMAPAAKAQQLIRRAYFDLIGLPPTLDDIRAFEKEYANNPSAAMESLVDRLLESPQYGERWARHWMDVARYSDVSGGMKNQGRDDRLPFAFTYRDYLIRSFNSDKPYNRFVMEQLAADQLDLEDKRDLAATAFIAIGSVAGTEEERIAERIDTVMQTFQGLTVGCARCHDHKFDPIPTEDYYSLRGVIASTSELGTAIRAELVNNEDCPIIEDVSDPELRKQYEDAVATAEKELREYEDGVWLPKEKQWRIDTPKYLDAMALTAKERGGLSAQDYVRSRLDRSVFGAWNQLINRANKKSSPEFAPWVALNRLGPDQFTAKFDKTMETLRSSNINKLVMDSIAEAKPKSMKDVARVYGELFTKANEQWEKELEIAGRESKNPPTALADADLEALRAYLYDPGMPPCRASNKVRDAFGNNDNKLNKLTKSLLDAKFHHPGAPVRAMGVKDKAEPSDSPVFVRGEPDQATDKVPRRFVSIVAGKEAPAFTKGSGRLEWAEAIAAPTNPLTARVIVNRVWMYHFGKGIVETTGDFGLQTPKPAHADLLEWLATTFIEDGWSLKKLHKRILLSATWQQSSAEHPQYEQLVTADPENTLVWRQNLKRLEFEPLRDSILFVTGNLDSTLHGRSLPLLSDPKANRRTVYAIIDRTTLPTVLSTFDVPNPNLTQGERFVSTVSPQALFLMNNAFVAHNVRLLARSEEFTKLPEDDTRIKWLYEKILHREASSSEIEILSKLLPPSKSPEQNAEEEKLTSASTDSTATDQDDSPKARAAKRKAEQMRKAELARKAAEAKRAKQAALRANGGIQPSNGWEKIIHTLLMSNEFTYVL